MATMKNFEFISESPSRDGLEKTVKLSLRTLGAFFTAFSVTYMAQVAVRPRLPGINKIIYVLPTLIGGFACRSYALQLKGNGVVTKSAS